jgi:hypothetical protein
VRTLAVLAGVVLMTASLTSAAAAATILVVSHDGQHQWQSRVTDEFGDPDPTAGSVTFVTGPGVPPRGTGSLRLMTNPGRGNGSAQIRSTGYAGVLLTNLTELTYYAYLTTNLPNGQQFPYLAIDVSCSTCPDGADRLFFEPPYQQPGTGGPTCSVPGQHPTAPLTWQKWDALNGCWWSNSGDGGNEGIFTEPLSTFTNLHPDAAIRNPSGVGGVRLAVGFASDVDNFDSNIDMVTIGVRGQGSTSYDFEPTPGQPTTGEGRVSGGGQINGTRGPANFGFNVRQTDTGATGHINYRNHMTGAELNCPVTTLSFAGNSATFGNMAAGCNFSVTVQDNGNPGKGNDTFSITSSSTMPPEFPSNNGTLTAGNIQVRSGP